MVNETFEDSMYINPYANYNVKLIYNWLIFKVI